MNHIFHDINVTILQCKFQCEGYNMIVTYNYNPVILNSISCEEAQDKHIRFLHTLISFGRTEVSKMSYLKNKEIFVNESR